MKHTWLTGKLPLLGLLGMLAPSALAGYPEFTDVQRRTAYPSPSQSESLINNYLFQDEQINILPTDGVIKVIRTDQKINIHDYVVRVFPIANANRSEIRNVIREVTAIEGGRAEVFVDSEGTGLSYVEVLAPAYMMPGIEQVIRELDVEWLNAYNDGATDVYYNAVHRDAADINVIAEVFAGDAGFSTIDTTNNAVRRFDEEYRAQKFLQAAAMVDIPCNMVLLEVTMYEVAASNDLKLGLDYVNWSNGPGRNLFAFAEAGYNGEQRAYGLSSIFDPFLDGRTFVGGDDKSLILDTAVNESYRAVNYLLPSSYIDFLQSKGKARVLTTAELMLCSANTGTIGAENQLLAFVNNTGNVTDIDVAPWIYDATAAREKLVVDADRTVTYENVGASGITMELTPFVGLESMELDVDLEIGEPIGTAPNGLPIMATRTISTTVRLLDGQPFVIAGLKKINDTNSSAKAPGLGSIPVLGYLFGGEQDLKRRDDIIVTITPHFILASQTNVTRPPQIDSLEAIVLGDRAQGTPSLDLFFDQYLIGS